MLDSIAILFRLIVHIARLPVLEPLSHMPHVTFSISSRSKLNLQHILLIVFGLIPEPIKLEKYGVPNLAVNSHSAFVLASVYVKMDSSRTLYVGIGKLNGLPRLSPLSITFMNASLIISIYGCISPYV